MECSFASRVPTELYSSKPRWKRGLERMTESGPNSGLGEIPHRKDPWRGETPRNDHSAAKLQPKRSADILVRLGGDSPGQADRNVRAPIESPRRSRTRTRCSKEGKGRRWQPGAGVSPGALPTVSAEPGKTPTAAGWCWRTFRGNTACRSCRKSPAANRPSSWWPSRWACDRA